MTKDQNGRYAEIWRSYNSVKGVIKKELKFRINLTKNKRTKDLWTKVKRRWN
jgi:hypothetical protein